MLSASPRLQERFNVYVNTKCTVAFICYRSEDGKSKIKVLQNWCLGKACFLVHRSGLLSVFSDDERGKTFSGPLF